MRLQFVFSELLLDEWAKNKDDGEGM